MSHGRSGCSEGMLRQEPWPERPAHAIAYESLQRMGTLQDIAQMALFRSSPQAAYVTGAVIPVDGGSSLRGGRDMRASYTPRDAA